MVLKTIVAVSFGASLGALLRLALSESFNATFPAIPPGNPGPPDRIGLFLIGGALALFMFGLETIGRGVVPQGMPQVGLGLGVMFGWAAIRHCLRVKRPALDLSLLKIPTFSQSTLAGTLFRVGAKRQTAAITAMAAIAAMAIQPEWRGLDGSRAGCGDAGA